MLYVSSCIMSCLCLHSGAHRWVAPASRMVYFRFSKVHQTEIIKLEKCSRCQWSNVKGQTFHIDQNIMFACSHITKNMYLLDI